MTVGALVRTELAIDQPPAAPPAPAAAAGAAVAFTAALAVAPCFTSSPSPATTTSPFGPAPAAGMAPALLCLAGAGAAGCCADEAVTRGAGAVGLGAKLVKYATGGGEGDFLDCSKARRGAAAVATPA